MDTRFDIIIVGGGPAGLTAGLYAARAGAKTLLLEGELIGGQASTTNVLENYPGCPNVGGPELMMAMERQAKGAGLEIRSEAVRAVDLSALTVSTRKAAYHARAMILATGARRRKLGVPGEDAFYGSGVSYCATCDGALYRSARVAVVGGGRTALEDALYLAGICERVTVIHRRDSFRAEEQVIGRVLGNDKIDVIWDSVVRAIERTESGLRLKLASTKTDQDADVDCAGCFVAVGTEPVTALYLGQVDMDENGYIRAGEDTKTSVPGVYAAGDLRAQPLKQVITAAADGAVAASEAVKYLTTVP